MNYPNTNLSKLPRTTKIRSKRKSLAQVPSSKQKFRVASHQAIKFQQFDFGWNRDWSAVEGLCTAFEAQKRTRTRHLLYMTQPTSLPTLFSTVMPTVKKEELGSLSKSEQQKLQRLYTQWFAANGSVRNLAKAAKLSPSKVREFLHSKTS